MKGVLEEAPEVLEETKNGPVRDAALISACQRVEHYEMAGYGSARDFAKLLAFVRSRHCWRRLSPKKEC
jgi:ferritin-like metal-binding protein YciE